MAHNLFLAMYSFQVKKVNTSDPIDLNDFLSDSYPDASNKFNNGFVAHVVSYFDKKAFKNKKNTHGGVLDTYTSNSGDRYLDVMLNGGVTGLKQFLIKEQGTTSVLSEKEIIGPKFYARFWLPGRSNTGYMFIQRYGALTIKPLFDDILNKILEEKGYRLVRGRMMPTATEKNQKLFFKHAVLKDVTVVSKASKFNTGNIESTSAVIKINRIKIDNSSNVITREQIDEALEPHGFKLADRKYSIKATYEHKAENDYKEEKTVYLDGSEETMNVIPNIIIPPVCIDSDNYPVFDEMKKLVNREIGQVIKEAKLS